jgi:hypothetical protein
MNEEPPPVQQRIVVPLTAEDAFALFTEGMASWWPFKTHSCTGDDALDVQFEPRVGGAVTELDRAGRRHRWGAVTAWAPPHHFAMTWHPAQSPALATALSVRFSAVNGGCEVALEHGGWGVRGAEAGEVRDSYLTGWEQVLGHYRERAMKGDPS